MRRKTGQRRMSRTAEEKKGKKKLLYFLKERSFAHSKYCKKVEKMGRKKAAERSRQSGQGSGMEGFRAGGWRAVLCSGMKGIVQK